MLRILHRFDRLVARIIFFRGHPRNVPLRFHADGSTCFQVVCDRRHW